MQRRRPSLNVAKTCRSCSPCIASGGGYVHRCWHPHNPCTQSGGGCVHRCWHPHNPCTASAGDCVHRCWHPHNPCTASAGDYVHRCQSPHSPCIVTVDGRARTGADHPRRSRHLLHACACGLPQEDPVEPQQPSLPPSRTEQTPSASLRRSLLLPPGLKQQRTHGGKETLQRARVPRR